MRLSELLKNLPEGTQKWLLLAVPYEEGPKEVKCATAPPAVTEAPAAQETPAVQEAPEQAPVERPAGCRCPDFSLDFNAKDAMCIRCVSKAECAAAMPR